MADTEILTTGGITVRRLAPALRFRALAAVLGATLVAGAAAGLGRPDEPAFHAIAAAIEPGAVRAVAVPAVVASPPTPEQPMPTALPLPARAPVTSVADQVAITPAGEVDLMVLTTSATSRARVLALGEAAGATVRHRRDAEGSLTLRVPMASSTQLGAAIGALSETSVERATVRSLAAAPNDEFYAKYQRPTMTQVSAEPAWGLTHGSPTVLIAVIDTGVDVSHPDLRGKVTGAYNAVTGSTDVTDAMGHGTFVASVAAASTDNGVGMAGAGFNTRLLAVKVAGADNMMYTSDVVEGIRWATARWADILNISLGSVLPSPTEAAAIAAAQAAGVLVIAAAGNDGAKTNPVMYPAGYPGVVGVASVDAAGARSSFSEYNDKVTVAAPGEDIAGAVPVAGSTLYPAAPGYPAYRLGDGTSFAAPIVAGEAALLMAAAPQATVAQIRAAIVKSAHAMPGMQVGAGLVDFRAALALLTPATIPAQTAPATGATVTSNGFLATATSAAAAVRFHFDGVAATALTPVVSGVARLTVDPTALASGAHTVTVADCTLGGLCGPASSSVAFTVVSPSLAITLPAPGRVDGVVTLTASVATATARWTVDGAALGAPVVAALGVASAPWLTYGLTNGPHVVGVSGCSTTGSCGPETTVTVTVANSAPVVLTPTEDQLLGGAFLVTAGARGGGVRFLLDGRSVGFAATAPYAVLLPAGSLDDGAHTVTVVSCDSVGTSCAGPASAARPFNLVSLHPVLQVSGATSFSPNGDGVRDVAGYTVTLVESQELSLTISTPEGAVVVARRLLGTFPAGTALLGWNGLSSSGAALPGGRYVLRVTSSALVAGRQLVGAADSIPLTIDLTAPGMTGLTASGFTFFPVKDGYLDTFAPLVTLSEGGTLTLTVRSGSGAVVKRLSGVRTAGRTSLVWDATGATGKVVPAGRYTWQYAVTDAAGNTRTASAASVVVSSARR